MIQRFWIHNPASGECKFVTSSGAKLLRHYGWRTPTKAELDQWRKRRLAEIVFAGMLPCEADVRH